MKTHLASLALLFALVGLACAQTQNVVVAPRERYSLGASTWNVNGETGVVTFNVSKLTFNHSGITGGIKLMLWATTQPYKPGTRGWTIAETQLGQLKSGQYYSNLCQNATLTRPPVGTHYLTLMVLEFGNDRKYTTKHYASGSKTFTFR